MENCPVPHLYTGGYIASTMCTVNVYSVNSFRLKEPLESWNGPGMGGREETILFSLYSHLPLSFPFKDLKTDGHPSSHDQLSAGFQDEHGQHGHDDHRGVLRAPQKGPLWGWTK